ncbi:hypothetical protein C8E01_106281 [Pontibacter virosus]|uniref:Uncharacterized protein n=1 Tax=Pontibacter virosus TaxID=1765052 RepID=A0A2U1AWZ1_9BACT|nr:hypothetical protein C8E01_106281 [Pontibacter virosus]
MKLNGSSGKKIQSLTLCSFNPCYASGFGCTNRYAAA